MSENQPQKQGNEINKGGGFSVIELLIVLIIIAIIAVFALPQILSSQRLISFTGIKNEMVSVFREVRQDAISQRKPISIRYDDSKKELVVAGGSYGVSGAATNKIIPLHGGGIYAENIKFGRPPSVPAAALGDSTTESNLTAGVIDISFQGDGSVRDGADNPLDHALYFYSDVLAADTAFALSILGSSGRVKVWTYSVADGKYVE